MDEEKGKIEVNYVPDDENSHHEVKKAGTAKTGKKSDAGALKKAQEKIKKQTEIMKMVVKERDEFRDKYLRNLAEIDNYRKRIKKEKEDFQKYALGEFLLNLLPVYDNLDRALKAVSEAKNEDSIVSGVSMIHKQFEELFKKNHLVEIEALNKPFDPNFHQALSREERDSVTEPTVVEVYQKGFVYNGKLLRPALTKVAIPISETEEPQPANGSETD